jgi:hypothetical protein
MDCANECLIQGSVGCAQAFELMGSVCFGGSAQHFDLPSQLNLKAISQLGGSFARKRYRRHLMTNAGAACNHVQHASYHAGRLASARSGFHHKVRVWFSSHALAIVGHIRRVTLFSDCKVNCNVSCFVDLLYWPRKLRHAVNWLFSSAPAFRLEMLTSACVSPHTLLYSQ